ncbi:peptidoglycan-binding protein [Nodularia sp. UHCC 0506]|uniref:peptidoglycan-binding protein n=1 Tax=Nodularia sp. UHCC 0506 TaxID=3110243 RepID=UPI002B215C2A|nr:peptidoglycan-binding protein [Nodularia sp. UHCC 0506]MEA5515085.1 peptidoglycan-binding protein [Nodularia sp. UHCC 0506]
MTCLTCLGIYPHRASTAAPDLASPKMAQTSSTIPITEEVVQFGSQGSYIQVMQIQLKDLGYYDGAIDGIYGRNTQNSVIEFQKSQNLAKTDGTVDVATRRSLQTAWTQINQFAVTAPCIPVTVPETEQPQPSQRGLMWLSLLGMGIIGSIGALLFLLRWLSQMKHQDQPESTSMEFKALSPGKEDLVSQPLPELEKVSEQYQDDVSILSPQTATASITTTVISPETTSRLSKLSIIDELIHDLRDSDRTKRRKAIWDLGQQGDSRAIQPLIDLMIHADSQQRSLILAALSEISARALKPMNRALAISLQDESPQVRQNAIRDLTRVYDMMIQMSQMLAHALEDPDNDVQKTAKYALTQMSKMRTVPNQQSLSEDHHHEA